jgi:hypothetical protein
MTSRFKWTPEFDDLLAELYKTNTANQIGEILGINRSSVKNRIYALGLKCPEKNRGCFPKGNVSWNKNKTMDEKTREKTKHTWFKKGHIPHNTKNENDIFSDRTDKNGKIYRFIKINHGKWQYYQRYLWEQNFGKIPPKHNVIFIDGNNFNFLLDNLKLVSNSELMEMNTIHRYPPEIKQLIILNTKIKNEIRKKHTAQSSHIGNDYNR